LKAADTSLVIAAFASWHDSHEAYDALVAATAADCNAELFTCDRRALPIYERYGVRTRFIP
jgi:predicted nucleic acid-binding protein